MTVTEAGLPLHLSHSQASELLSCGEKFRLNRVWHVPEVPSWALIGGSAVHEATEQYDMHRLTADVPAPESFDQIFERMTVAEEERHELPRTRFRAAGRRSAAWPNKEDQDWWLTNGPLMVDRWASFVTTSGMTVWVTPEGAPAVEVAFELDMPAVNTRVKLAIDRILQDPGGELWIVDIKTGSTTPTYPEQVETYRVAAQRRWPGVDFPNGAFWDARNGGMGSTFWLTKDYEWAEYKFGMVKRMRDQGLFIANPGQQCSWCQVKDYCYAQNGKMAGAVRPPWVSVQDWEEGRS